VNVRYIYIYIFCVCMCILYVCTSHAKSVGVFVQARRRVLRHVFELNYVRDAI